MTAVEITARDAIETIRRISGALLTAKHRIRGKHNFYSQDLINTLFQHPYTKIQFLERDLSVSRITATRYLDVLAADGFLRKQRIGRTNYYMNTDLLEILTGESMGGVS